MTAHFLGGPLQLRRHRSLAGSGVRRFGLLYLDRNEFWTMERAQCPPLIS
jgi:hypothetical protein